MFVFVLVKVLSLSGRSSNQQCNGKLNGTPCLKQCPEPDCRQVVRIHKESFICKVIKTDGFFSRNVTMDAVREEPLHAKKQR